MTAHFIDVGQGLSILVQSEKDNLVYDGGGAEHANQVVSYLQQQNVQKIDYLISSHYDEDHVSGLIHCLNSFSVRNVIGPDYVQDSMTYTRFMDTIASKGLSVTHPDVGDTFSFGSGQFTILAPNGISTSDNNRNSVCINWKMAQTVFFLLETPKKSVNKI